MPFQSRSDLTADLPLPVAVLVGWRPRLGVQIRAVDLVAIINEALGWHWGGKIWGFKATLR